MRRGLDHLVLAVRDLDAAAGLYERLGFQVGGRNRHPWGTENRLVQFAGTFLELITVGQGAAIEAHRERSFSFGAFVQDYLARREGLAMVVLDSADSKADARAFAERGGGAYEPFFFERGGRRPDGTETQVAFTLAFAEPLSPSATFFVCQHHFPQNFWNAAFQKHANEAEGVSTVALATQRPDAHEAFLTHLTGVSPIHPDGDDSSYPLARGRLDVLTNDDAAEIYGSVEADPHEIAFVGYGLRVPDMRAQAARLEAAMIPYQAIGARLVVPSSAAFGVAIAFEPD